ncbi:D-2-hydroxyglutarate dehydrogenase YdiJ [Pasteurella multocida]|uniref:D-2-hydroxyglutarate dehydrogenase YdiJ n=1 Tax=Pasteurella multocida TaxID=747 RepID=UPI00061A89B8|nr:FAD-binding and (Fe-S)-binding domain-containing protein [Pasteurella multocida]AKD39609.1 FAD-linked oxidase family protein [Pasteurella multocida OH1905]URJ90218.1 FAD-binding oxidoreductase [Pasteurella multocida]WRK05896.1 FAD-binding and (Fe-S)-binding domain-containing protein [Pasteurella multocida]HDR1788596.1 FAD-binding oxidoreductase [Pasteurella multocida]
MLPRLTNIPQLTPLVSAYLNDLQAQHFEGDISTHYAERLSLATDNSVYQQLPQAILFPKSIADVVRLTKLAQQHAYKSLTFTPRGGGTGTNGQSLNNNIIVDLSRHMTAILELNVEQRWVKVQAGVVKDQLNQFLKPYGLFFSPELSTSNRATLGGMINTDASGQGSLQYGKTSDHVLGLRAVLMNGEILETGAIKTEEFADNLVQSHLSKSHQYLHQEIFQRCQQKRAQILNDLPQLNRFITGYDLKNVFNHDESEFNLTRILTGSEGSLAFICEATLDLTPIPQYRTLINVKYSSFDAALRNAPFMVKANALSVETIDSKVLNLAKQDIIWHSVSELLTEQEENPILGLNIVEYASNDKGQIHRQVQALCTELDKKITHQQDAIIGYQVCSDLASIERIYAMRKKAVGLLGNAKGIAKPIPFVEDSCVPPEHLADYIAEFRALLDAHKLDYGMFGHVDAGVLHVRPALNLCDKAQVKLFKEISDQVVALTHKYGGLIWGEHGKGMRSQYGETFFTPELWQELRYIKFLFDPDNRLNPGKICTPLNSKAELYSILSPMRADHDRQIPIQMRETFNGAMNCNGNGLCFNFDVHSAMCPSMKISKNRLFSPKGRASMIREWLRLLANENVTPEQLNFRQHEVKMTDFVAKIRNTVQKWRGEYDFSHEVKAAMDTCLACKACASQCPIKIDVPNFRAKFFHFYYGRYLRSAKDHVIANVEYMAPLMAKKPAFFNFFTTSKFAQMAAEKVLGIVDLPTLSEPSLAQQLIEIDYQAYSLEQLERLSEQEKQRTVLIVQDPFTSYYDAKVVADFVALLQKLTYKPVLLPFKPNGKALHVKGFLSRFAKTAQNQADVLSRLAKLGIPMVGVDPAIVLTYRDEYKEVLGQARGDFEVLTSQEWLTSQQTQLQTLIQNFAKTDRTYPTQQWYLFSHCTESTALPNSGKGWQQLFALFGQELKIENVGCCGMAGTFGHETAHLAMSKDIYALSWAKKLAGKDPHFCLATGYSCRSQVKRLEKWQPQHPVQALLSLLK